MSPLHHDDDLLPSQVESRLRTLRPASESDSNVGSEKKPKALRLQDDPTIALDARVKRLAARLETLIEARADHRVIAMAQAKVDNACLDVLEKRALINKTARETAEEARKQKERDAIQAETLHRMSGFAQCAIKIGRYSITLLMDRSLDPTARQHVMGDLHRLLALQEREASRTAAQARTGQVVTEQPKRLLDEIKDVIRRAIAHGCVEIREI
jgi:hypothetical protein